MMLFAPKHPDAVHFPVKAIGGVTFWKHLINGRSDELSTPGKEKRTTLREEENDWCALTDLIDGCWV